MKRVFGLGKGRSMGISRTSQTATATPIPTSSGPLTAARGMDAPFTVQTSGNKPIAPSDLAAAAAAAAARQEVARQEAAGKLALNHILVINDIIKNSGLGALVGRLTTATAAAPAAAEAVAAPVVAAVASSSSSGGSVPLTWEQQAAADESRSSSGESSSQPDSPQQSAPHSSSADSCVPTSNVSDSGTNGYSLDKPSGTASGALLNGVAAWKAATPAAAPGPRSSDNQVRAAIDETLRRVVTHLLGGDAGTPLSPELREQAAVGAAALAFFHNRASAPRDMSAAAVVELRAACMAVMRELY